MILNTINHDNQFYKHKKHLNHVFKYTRDDNSENLCIKNHMTCGDVIVATNLAGRGTDIKLEKNVTKCGGLHVIVAFEPENERILRQNIGRTCRAGRRGSGIIIINSETCDYYVGTENVDSVKKMRQRYANRRMSTLEQSLRSEMKKEEYYTKFVCLIEALEWKYWHKPRGTIHNRTCCSQASDSERILSGTVKKQIEYKWSLIYPKIKCDTKEEIEKSERLWQQFEREVRRDLDYYQHELCYNPFYLNRAALWGDLYNGLSCTERQKMLDKVIDKLDSPVNQAISYYLKAFVNLESCDSCSPSKETRSESREYLERANQYFELLKNRCDVWKTLYTTVKMVNGTKRNGTKTDLDSMIEFERCTFWEALQETCNECLKNIDHPKIEISLESIDDYFKSKKCSIYDRVIGNYRQCGLTHIIIISKKPPGFWDRVGAAFTAVIGVCQVIGGALLVACSGGALYSLGAHCIKRGVHKVVAGIKGLFTDDFYFSEFWKEELMAELTGLIGVAVQVWGGPLSEKILPTKITELLDVGKEMNDNLSATQLIGSAIADELKEIDPSIDNLFNMGGDIFNVYNNLKTGTFKFQDVTNAASYMMDEKVGKRVRGAGRLLDDFVGGDFDHTKVSSYTKTARDVSDTALSEELQRKVNPWINAADNFANKRYVRGVCDTAAACGVTSAQYLSIIDDFRKDPSFTNGIRLVTHILSNHCKYIDDIGNLIEEMIASNKNGMTFDSVCNSISKLLKQFDALNGSSSGSSFTSVLSNITSLVQELGKLRGKGRGTVSMVQTIINCVDNIVQIVSNLSGSSNINSLEYVLGLYRLTQNLMKNKDTKTMLEILKFVSKYHLNDSKSKPFIQVACDFFEMKSARDSMNIVVKSANLVFDGKTSSKKISPLLSLFSYAMELNGNNTIKFDNDTFRICEYTFDMVLNNASSDWESDFTPIMQIMTMLNEQNINQIDLIESSLTILNQFFLPHNKNMVNRNVYCKQFLNFTNIWSSIISVIKSNNNPGFTIPAVLKEIKNIATMFSSDHGDIVHAIYDYLRRDTKVTQEMWDAKATLKDTIAAIEFQLNQSELKEMYSDEATMVHGLLNSIIFCRKRINNNTFTFGQLFDIVRKFESMTPGNTWKNQEMTVFRTVCQSSERIINEIIRMNQNINRNGNQTSIKSILELLDRLFAVHPFVQQKQIDTKSIIKCVDNLIYRMNRFCQNGSKDNVSTVMSMIDILNTSTESIFGKSMSFTINNLSNFIKHLSCMKKDMTVSSIVEFVQFLVRISSSSNSFDCGGLTDNININNDFGNITNCTFDDVKFDKDHPLSEESIEREMDLLTNSFASHPSIIKGSKTMSEIGKCYENVKQFGSNGEADSMINKTVAKQLKQLINNKLNNDKEFRYLFCYWEEIQSNMIQRESDKKKKENIENILVNVCNRSINQIVKKSKLSKELSKIIMSMNSNGNKFDIKNIINHITNILESNRKICNCINQIVDKSVMQLKKYLRGDVDRMDEQYKTKRFEQVTKTVEDIFGQLDQQLGCWRTDTEKMEAGITALIEQLDFITRDEVNKLQKSFKFGKFIEKLKDKMANNVLNKELAKERKRVENLEVKMDNMDRICDSISMTISKSLSDVVDNVVKNMMDSLDTEWVEEYENATNNFMNSLQVYYQKKLNTNRR